MKKDNLYGFEYNKERKLYRDIKDYTKESEKKVTRYSEWKKHIEEKYVNDKNCFVQIELEDFCRFLKRKQRNANQCKEIIQAVAIPLEVVILSAYYNANKDRLGLVLVGLLILICLVLFLYIYIYVSFCYEADFVTDLLEIVNPDEHNKWQ